MCNSEAHNNLEKQVRTLTAENYELNEECYGFEERVTELKERAERAEAQLVALREALGFWLSLEVAGDEVGAIRNEHFALLAQGQEKRTDWIASEHHDPHVGTTKLSI